MSNPGKIYVIGMGPGNLDHMSPVALEAIENSDRIIGYKTYIELVLSLIKDKKVEDFTEAEIKRIKHKVKNHKQHDIRKGRQVKIKLDYGLIGYRETQLKFIDFLYITT
mgnify:CR=1 FL=1